MGRIRFQALFRGIGKIIIVILCIYVAGKSVALMVEDNSKTAKKEENLGQAIMENLSKSQCY